MSTPGKADNVRILVVRLGSMGDILHTLPAVATLKNSYPESHLTWAVEPRWTPLIEDNPFVDNLVLLHRGSVTGLARTWRALRATRYDFAIDFQGLLKSAVLAAAARPDRIYGWVRRQLREPAAAWFYSDLVTGSAAHVVDRNLELAAAAGAENTLNVSPLPPGVPQGNLPAGDFVLASPLAGWRSKQWPMEHYRALAIRLERETGIPLVLNVPDAAGLPAVQPLRPHVSGLAGLIHATRRAVAVVGVDSGPMHLAAALAKPGVAIFGPTDPARNGPYGNSLRVLRWPHASTTYKRGTEIEESMRRVTPDQVFEALVGKGKGLSAGPRAREAY
jgi:heptosyltransferase-1